MTSMSRLLLDCLEILPVFSSVGSRRAPAGRVRTGCPAPRWELAQPVCLSGSDPAPTLPLPLNRAMACRNSAYRASAGTAGGCHSPTALESPLLRSVAGQPHLVPADGHSFSEGIASWIACGEICITQPPDSGKLRTRIAAIPSRLTPPSVVVVATMAMRAMRAMRETTSPCPIAWFAAASPRSSAPRRSARPGVHRARPARQHRCLRGAPKYRPTGLGGGCPPRGASRSPTAPA